MSTLSFNTLPGGQTRIQGVFRLADETGFPISMSYEEAKGRGFEIDWVEALADAGRQGSTKFDPLMHEIEMLVPDRKEIIQTIFISYFNGIAGPDGDFCERCQRIYDFVHLPTKVRLDRLTTGFKRK